MLELLYFYIRQIKECAKKGYLLGNSRLIDKKPACSFLFGTGLIDKLNAETSRGKAEEGRILHASLFAIAILALRTFEEYLKTQPNHCGYSINGAPMQTLCSIG